MSLLPLSWYDETVCGLLRTQQVTVFILHGNIGDYPQNPGEDLPAFLIRRTEAEALVMDLPEGEAPPQEVSRETLVERRRLATFDLTRGLRFSSKEGQAVFDRGQGPPPPPLGVNPQDLLRDPAVALGHHPRGAPAPHAHRQAGRPDPAEGGPARPAERPLLDQLCEWAGSDLLFGLGRETSRVFLLTPEPEHLSAALRRSAAVCVGVPLPDVAQRTRFLGSLLSDPSEPPPEGGRRCPSPASKRG